MATFEFDHVGITTTVPQPREDWVEASRIWVTNPRHHPEHIEFLRYEPDSTVPAAARGRGRHRDRQAVVGLTGRCCGPGTARSS